MKTIFTTLMLSLLIMKSVYSQNNNLIIYSQDGFKFTVILNGIRQNASPETNVKVTGLNATNYQVKVIFENKMADLDQNAYLMYGGNPTQNTEYSYAIKGTKDKLKLKFQSAAPFEVSAPPPVDPQQTVVTYSPVDVVAVNTGGVSTTTTTTTNTVGTTTNAVGNSVGMNVNGVGVGISINVTDPTMMGTTGVTSGSTTTTTSTTTTSSSGGTMSGGDVVIHDNNAYVLPGYSGVYGCPYPMGQSDFESAKQSISSKGFDESKLTIAKQIIGSNCMLCSQIKEMMLLLSFEESRLDLAKFAWSHNLDRGNYYKLNDAFTFETSIDELNQYTQSH